MCRLCEIDRDQHQKLAREGSCCRIVCQCGNLLDKRPLILPYEIEGTTAFTVGECCSETYGIPSFYPSDHVTKHTKPGSLDERQKRREK